MTCITGIARGGTVWIGGDSCGSDEIISVERLDGKVFVIGEFVMGFTTSFRMGNLLQYKFRPPKQRAEETDHEFMATRIIDEIRKVLDDGGFARKKDGEEKGGKFLVGYRGVLYVVDSDYQVGIPSCGYKAIGSGRGVALGALHATPDSMHPSERITKALEAATYWTPYVREPFKILSVTWEGE